MLNLKDHLYIIEKILICFQKLLENGIVFSDLKPANIVILRYINKEDSEITVYKHCY